MSDKIYYVKFCDKILVKKGRLLIILRKELQCEGAIAPEAISTLPLLSNKEIATPNLW